MFLFVELLLSSSPPPVFCLCFVFSSISFYITHICHAPPNVLYVT